LAWVLLSVFVPMLLLSSLHTHGVSQDMAAACKECIHHPHHSHFDASSFQVSHCVLCQFTVIPFVVAATISLGLVVFSWKACLGVSLQAAVSVTVFRWSGRAPPF